jgi:signal transduction histidine kinase
MMTQLPLRIRLTLWYSAAFAVAVFCFGFGCLWMVHRAVTDLEEDELHQRVRGVRRFLEVRPAQETPAQRRDAITAAYDVSHGAKWLQVIDDHGNWLYRSPHVAEVYPELATPQQLKQSSTSFTYIVGSAHVRALIEPITVNGIGYTVQTGLTLNKSLALLSNFQIQLWVLAALGLIAASIAGYFLSRKALSPIAALAREIQHINDRNLNNRLPALQTRDELAALSATLNQMLERIESGYQAVRSFTANAAHELRTPVALLHAEVEITLAFPRDVGYYRESCEKVLRDSAQMARLIDQLLALARMDAGTEILHMELLNLNELVEEVGSRWHERFSDAEIRFTVAAGATASWVEGDFVGLKRLLDTLLENAWRYTPSGRLVTISLSNTAQHAELSVCDTGAGISLEIQSKIFQRFSRWAEPLRGDFSSSGLGLALAKWIAEGHHSSLILKSTPGTGSCFSISLKKVSAPNGATHLFTSDRHSSVSYT